MKYLLFIYRLIFPIKNNKLPEPKKVQKIVRMELEYKIDLIYRLKTGENLQSQILPYYYESTRELDLGYLRRINIKGLDQNGLSKEEYNSRYIKFVNIKSFSNPDVNQAEDIIRSIDSKFVPIETIQKTLIGINADDITTITATRVANKEVEIIEYKVIENGEEEKTEVSNS